MAEPRIANEEPPVPKGAEYLYVSPRLDGLDVDLHFQVFQGGAQGILNAIDEFMGDKPESVIASPTAQAFVVKR